MTQLSSEKVRIRRRRRPKLTVLLTILGLCALFGTTGSMEEIRCPSLDVRNWPTALSVRNFDVAKIRKCTILEGSLSLSFITNASVTESDFFVFDNLREITGYLLIFQVKSLRTLSRIFPNLRVIGGQQMIMNYALIIFQNMDFENVGLTKLTTIRNGGVRIAENSRLCYAKNIDWQHIMSGPINDLLVDDSTQTGEGQCNDECVVDDGLMCRDVQGQVSCWTADECQIDCPYERYMNGTVSLPGPGPGCSDKDGEKCHKQCVGGCTVSNDNSACHACLHFFHNEECIEKCPDGLYAVMDRRCVNKTECHRSNRRNKAYQNKCDVLCPEGWQEDPSNAHECIKCVADCPRRCPGLAIDTLTTALTLKKCSVIEGNIEIEMRNGMDSVAPEKLTEAFGKIEVIEGYLLIRFSPAFISLHMFKSLRLIKGKKKFREKYSVVVFENSNLRQLFDPRNPLVVENGKLQFQNNRMLCYFKIKELLKNLGKTDELDETDQSSFSNGDKAICEESTFDVNVTDVLNNGFLLQWTSFNTSDMDHRKFLGYQVFYKEVDKIDPDMSIDDDRSACSDSWSMHFEGEKDDGKELTRGTLIATEAIKADTLYAFYVQTRMVNHPGARNAVSKIGFLKTKFGQPGPPRINKHQAIGHDKILLEWDPPAVPNGEITHYVVTWVRQRDEIHYKLACGEGSNGGRHLSRPDPSHIDPLHGGSSPGLRSHLLTGATPSTPEDGTCAKIEGCCQCSSRDTLPSSSIDSLPKVNDDDVVDHAHFENAIQNVIFVQHKRRRRALDTHPKDKDLAEELLSSATTLLDLEEYTQKKVNVSAQTFTITGLKHHANYRITISACQNLSEPENHCSPRPSWKDIRTKDIPENDIVANETIVVEIINGTHSDTRIMWDEPEDPNGHILGYKVKLVNTAKQTTPLEQCVSRPQFNESGMTFFGLSDGEYIVEVRTVTHAGISDPARLESLFRVRTPGFFTLQRILILCIVLIILFSLGAIIVWRCVKVYYGKQVGEFIRQISANPEYLSQMDVYKQDEWELQRSDLILDEEIGRGTFGKVFRGKGHNVRSQCGEYFGECAIKTVTEAANSAERLHFLIEASVMKQFNTSFIVKLYGVVSDGQPVLVVMEMMGKGNLRDYLRSRRPESEDNPDNLPVPTEQKYFEWAAQIADGMAYLESLKFCHRDLAARNCMVHANETVKIGDFGMARDIYYHEYYKPTGKRLMPVRWMAPESLKDGKFTMKSDVWSYGIVLYEMLTLAQQPYQGLANDEVFTFIGVSRKILDKPMGCPDFWYDLMVSCWRYVPRERPSFHQLVHHLLQYTTDEFKTKSHVVNTPEPEHSSGEEREYVPEGHGRQHKPNKLVEMLVAARENEMESTLCHYNRAEDDIPNNWRGEEEKFNVEVEDEL